MTGAADVAGHVAKSLGLQALAGIKGLSELPHGMDAAADAIRKYQTEHDPDLSPSGQTFVRNTLAPAVARVHQVAPAVSTLSPAMTLMQKYSQAVPMAADAAGKLNPSLGGAVGALGEAAPYAGFPEGRTEEAADLLSKYGTQPVLPDGTTERTLAREAAAAQRRAAEGLPAPEVPPSEFQGRQAEHEGAVARLNQPPAYVKTKIPASQLDPSLHPPSFSPPDNAVSYVAMDPETGAQLSHVTYVQRGGAMQSLRQDTRPGYQGQGIGSDLLSDAISDAHGQGMDFYSDTQLSVPAARAYEKIPGAVRNEDVTHAIDPNDGDVGISNNGRPVYSVLKQVPADEAEVGEIPHFNPNSYIGSQAFAEGGKSGAALEDVANLLKKYGSQEAPSKQIANLPKATVDADPTERIHNMNMFMQGAHPSMLEQGGWPKTFYHGTQVQFKPQTQLGDIQSFDPAAVQAFGGGMNVVTKPSGETFLRSFNSKPKFDSFGSWFSDNPGAGGAQMFSGDGSEGGSMIYPVHINLKNPYQPANWDEFYSQYSKVSPSLPKDPAKMKAWLQSQGHDGIVFPSSNYDGGNHSMIVALDPTQVKSAVGNVGTFDPTDPDITKASGGVVNAAAGGGVAEDIASLLAKYSRSGALEGAPVVSRVGAVDVPVGPNDTARKAAASYMNEAGIRPNPQTTYAKADPARGKAIAAAFEAMPHAPDDPDVKSSYDAMIKETLAQYQHMKKAGVNVEFMPPGQDPYAASPRLMLKDLADNNHMYVYPTNAGFGSSSAEDIAGNPLLGDSGEKFGGVPATNNDVFRAVHDYFGHAKEGVGFRADGEENAWQQHARMYSDQARPAMTTETRGQNSWVNFGPHGETNKTASAADTVYAPQKTGLLPPEFSDINDGMMHFLHMSNLTDPEVILDPSFYGTGMKGAEAARGGTKTISLYPYDLPASQVEQPLQSKTPYRVSLPAAALYDMSADPAGIRASAPSFSDAEDAVRDAGYLGYHTPNGEGLFRGQARLFGATPATRIASSREPAPVSSTSRSAPSSNPKVAAAPVGIYDDTMDTSDFAAGGHVARFADGGELGTGVDDIMNLISKYSAPVDKDAQAVHLLSTLGDQGSVTYNPTSGDVHQAGYAVPHEINRSVSFDGPPSADDIHDFLTANQDAFENPKAAIHIESDDEGNHFMHVAHVEPDYEGAVAAATSHGANGVRELHTGKNLTIDPSGQAMIADSLADPNPAIDEYLSGTKIPASDLPHTIDTDRNQRPATAWQHGKPTVDPAQRVAFPGIYNDPRQTIADSNAMVAPEDPLLRRLFGVSRQDLSDIALSRQGNEIGVLPGAKQGATGAASARAVMTPQNEQRLIDVLTEARGTPLHTGMTGWYSMDPLYQRFVQIFGEDEAPAKYAQFNTLSGMASPGSDVGTEIARGTSANWLNSQGRFGDFLKYAGISNEDRPGIRGFPQDMLQVPGHAYHPTAQAGPMEAYLRTGSIQMKSPKVPMYIGASGVPETGFQTDMPVGDAHWARGVGLADTRNPRTKKGEPVIPGSSASTPEMQTLGPWWRDRVAAQAGYGAVPAQATAWGAFAPYTGVESAIGAPKLEILATQIGKLADRLGLSPETARDLVITGKAGAF